MAGDRETMRIGLYTPTYPGLTGEGGIGTYTRTLAQVLSKRGHVVHVLTPGDRAAIEHDGEVSIHFTRVGHFPVLDRVVPGIGTCTRIGMAMRRLASEWRLDIVEFPNWEGSALVYSFSRPAPLAVRLYTSTAETVATDRLTWNASLRWDARRERWAARRADLLVTHSDAHRRLMALELAVAPSRIQLVPLGLSIPDSRPACLGARSTLNIVCLGRLERRKGTLDLLRAVPDTLRRVPRARLVLIGADRPHCPGGKTHKQWAEDSLPAAALARIEFAGVIPDEAVEERLREAHLLVAPSLYESFGLILLEAMRLGVPVVSTRAGAIPEVVRDGETGVLVDAGYPDQLASQISGLLLDEHRRRSLAEAGRQRFLAEFTDDRMAERVEALYSGHLAQSPR